MADKKITQLNNITGANLVDADEFVVVDISADETKAITLGELKEAFDAGSGFVRVTGDTMTGDLTVPNVITSGNVDGRDVSVDGTKLDGIEDGATVDQTASEIKTAYESNADTNEFSDAEQTKLAGITAGANIYTDADVDTYLAGVGNVVVGGTVDGVDIAARDAILTSTTTTASAALPKSGGAMTGAITTNSTFDGRDVAADGTKLDGIETGATADQTAAQLLTAVKTVDGSGSGLDADLLDGLHLTSQNRNNQANSVVRTQADGYAEFGWINTTSGDTSGGLSRVYVDTGDGYLRKCSLAHLKSQMGGSNPYTAQSLATNGYIKLVGGLIIQWGQSGATSSGDINVTFPTTFPSACRSFTSTMTGGIGSENWVNGFSVIGFYTSYARVRCRTDSGSAGITWMAIGY
jgi:hypothetical protein